MPKNIIILAAALACAPLLNKLIHKQADIWERIHNKPYPWRRFITPYIVVSACVAVVVVVVREILR